jgi:hypothetical protein
LASFEEVLRHFNRQIELRWQPDVAPEGRVWILWYDKALDRRVRGRLVEFQQATEGSGHGWRLLDLVNAFERWIVEHDFFDALLEAPAELTGMLPDFRQAVAERVRSELASCGPNDLLAISGCAALFGLLRTSDLIADAAPQIQGRLLLLFPGRHSANVYRLLDARESWNYRAVPIPAADAY